MSTIEIIHLVETTSTNDYLKTYEPKADITAVYADYQSAGRGQSGAWLSPMGENLMFSILVEPDAIRASEGFVLSMANALAMKDAIGQYIEDVWIKWPNDIYCNNRKIVGTLIENTLKGKNIGRCIIGTGLNVNQTEFPDGLAAPTSSMKLLQKAQKRIEENVDREVVFREIVGRFACYYDEIRQGGVENIRQRYHDALYLRGIDHDFSDNDCVFSGKIQYVEPDGHIHITDSKGRDRVYGFKEVKLVHKNI